MRRLDAYLRQSVACGDVPGAVVCVAHRGEVVWHEAYGAAAWLPERRVMRRDTLFDVASLTKVIATTPLVLAAHRDGVLQLDDPLRRFYPGAPDDVGAVTVRQLLAHSGGLADWLPLYARLDANGTARQRRRQAAALILQEPLAYRPGQAAVYSDLGFIVLGDLLETCYGQPLDVLFEHRVARPLGLRRVAYRPLDAPAPGGPSWERGLPARQAHPPAFAATERCDPSWERGLPARQAQPPAFAATERCDLPWERGLPARQARPPAFAATERCDWRGRVLSGEVHDANAWAMGGVAAHAGLFASAAGVWAFAHAMLEAAAGRREWLPPALLRQSWQRQATPPGTTRALGWDTPTPGRSSAGAFFSPNAVGHLGFTGCSLWIDLDRRVSVVLCTNRVHPARQADGIARLRPRVHDLVMHALGVAAA